MSGTSSLSSGLADRSDVAARAAAPVPTAFPVLRSWRSPLRGLSPERLLADLLRKRWAEALFPFLIMVAVLVAAAVMIDGYASPGNLARTGREFAEFGFVTVAMALVLMSGGIDLSLGAVFALANMLALLLLALAGWPVWVVVPTTLVFGALVGAWNGVLVGYVKTRPFITTLTTLIIGRAVVSLLDQRFSADLAASSIDSEAWAFLGAGSIAGVPTNIALLLFVGVLAHVLLTRSRPGAHLIATGGDRRAAIHAGIDIRRVLLGTYALAGMLAALAGLLYAARLDSGSANAGRGMEIMALAAAVLGGVSLAGGRGSVARALIGATIILVLINALVRFGVSGSSQSVWLGLVVLAAVAADVRWAKNRGRALDRLALVPARLNLPAPRLPTRSDPDALAVNDALRDAIPHAEGEVFGPGGLAFDAEDRLCIGTAEGWVMRYGPDRFYRAKEHWLRTGGWPLGLAFDGQGRLVMTVAGRGLYRAKPSGEIEELATSKPRSSLSLHDDSRLRVPTDLDIGPDGTIYFGEGSSRFEAQGWLFDAIEGRGNGALVAFDPRTGRARTLAGGLAYCGGVCLTHGGDALYVASTWEARIDRLALKGPEAGRLVPFLDSLPGYPAAIHRGSGGGYWVSFIGLRSPAFNLSMRMPDVRRRMVRQLPPDEWLAPNVNVGLVARFNDAAQFTRSLWDPLGRNHGFLTCAREHRGHLYLASINGAKFGRKALDDADPSWTDQGPQG